MKNVILISLALVLFGAACIALAASQIPSVCRNIDGVEMCVVTKDNIEKLLDKYDEAVYKLRKTSADCKRLNEG